MRTCFLLFFVQRQFNQLFSQSNKRSKTTSKMIVRHHRSFFILCSVAMLLTTTLPVQCDVSCDTGQFYVGGAGNVTCHFGENVRVTKHNFNIVLYTNPQDSGTYVLLCNWEKESLECNVKQNYRFDQATTLVTDSLVLEIPTVAESMAGLYVCQLVPDNGIPVHTCQLNVTDPPPTTPPPCTAGTTSNPLTANQGTDDQGQKGVIGVLIAMVGGWLLVLIFIVCFVLLWYKFDLVKRTERADNPDGWTEHIICCKLCNVLGIKRPVGLADRDDLESNKNETSKKQFKSNSDDPHGKASELKPLLVEDDKTKKLIVIVNENYRRDSLGAAVGKGACFGDDDRDYVDGNVGEGTATAEVAPVSTPESPQNPDAVKEENPPKPQILTENENEMSGQNAPPGSDNKFANAAATDENPPGDPSGEPMDSESSTLNQTSDGRIPPTRPDRQSKSGSSSPRSPRSAPPTIPLDKHLSDHIHKVDPDNYESETTSGQGNRKSASPSPDRKDVGNKSLPYKPILVPPAKFVPSPRMAGRSHRGQKLDDKSGPPEKESTTHPPVASAEHPPAAAQGPPPQSLSDSRNDDKINDNQITSPKSPVTSPDNSSVDDSTRKASENKKDEDTGNTGNPDLFKKHGDNGKVGPESNPSAAAVPEQIDENGQKTKLPDPLQEKSPDSVSDVYVAAAHPSTSSETPCAQTIAGTEGLAQPHEAKEEMEKKSQEGDGPQALGLVESDNITQPTSGVPPTKPQSVTSQPEPCGGGDETNASTMVPGTENKSPAEETTSENDGFGKEHDVSKENQDAEANKSAQAANASAIDTTDSAPVGPGVQPQEIKLVSELPSKSQGNVIVGVKVDPSKVPLPDDDNDTTDNNDIPPPCLPSHDKKEGSPTDGDDGAVHAVGNLETPSAKGKPIAKQPHTAQPNKDTSDIKQDDSGVNKQDDSGATKQDYSGATTQDDRGATTQDDRGATKQDDKGATKPDDKGATKQDDGGATKQDDGGTTTQDDGGATKQDDGGATTQDDGGATKQDDGGTTKQDDGGVTTQDDGGVTTQDDGGATKQDDGGATTQDDGGATKQDDGGATKQDDGGVTTQDDGGATTQDDGGATTQDDGGATKQDDGGDITQDDGNKKQYDGGVRKADDSGATKQDDSGNINPENEGDTKQNDIEEASNDQDDEKTTDNPASKNSQETQNADKEQDTDSVTPPSAESESKQSPDTGSPESSDKSNTGSLLGRWLWGGK